MQPHRVKKTIRTVRVIGPRVLSLIYDRVRKQSIVVSIRSPTRCLKQGSKQQSVVLVTKKCNRLGSRPLSKIHRPSLATLRRRSTHREKVAEVINSVRSAGVWLICSSN